MSINWSKKLQKQENWLVTGCAGFIGSHIVETLLKANQKVTGLDNFSTGSQENIDELKRLPESEKNFSFIEGDIQNAETCAHVLNGVDHVIHQAALGSVPRSLETPVLSHNSNVNGFIVLLNAVKEAGIKRFVYASSSSVYGDHPDLPKVEENVGIPQSPYAATKKIDEIYAEVFAKSYNLSTVGLRYFNVFGARQNPNGPYSAVIPRWLKQMTAGEDIEIFGDGKTSRDFCYVDNAVQANILAAIAPLPESSSTILNVAFGQQTSLLELIELLKENLKELSGNSYTGNVVHSDFRKGDVRHSLADTTKAKELIGYDPQFDIRSGLVHACKWYFENL